MSEQKPPPHEKSFKVTSKEIILGAISFLMVLAWNDAFKDYIGRYPELHKYGMFAYAVFVTIFVILVSWLIAKW